VCQSQSTGAQDPRLQFAVAGHMPHTDFSVQLTHLVGRRDLADAAGGEILSTVAEAPARMSYLCASESTQILRWPYGSMANELRRRR